MTRALACCIAFIVGPICLELPLPAQTAAPDANTPSTTLRVNSRAVLVDVVVTDKSGKPVTGLKRDAFAVTEQGKPQTIGYFEEHAGTPAAAAPIDMPKFPPDVFSNFSPFPQPAAVNVLLLDSLNTRMEDQAVVHERAMKFLKSAKPGTRTAIFTMGLGLHFIQGFNDDPSVLAAALNNKKNNEVQNAEMMKGQEQSNAEADLIGMMSAPVGNGATAADPGMIADLQRFIAENDLSHDVDREALTLANMQRLAAFLQGFPGRKNIIWFADTVPAAFVKGPTTGNPAIDDEIEKTLAMLAAARAAIYPVYARGISNESLYSAENNLSHALTQASQIIGSRGAFVGSVTSDDMERNADQEKAQILADQSGGRAFAVNGLSEVIQKVTSDSSYFYTLSYKPTNAKMDGGFRKINVKVAGGNFDVSYRRGYFARDIDLPGSALATRDRAVNKIAAQNPGAVDPLLPFMDLGMPQSEQILYMAKIQPLAPKADAGAAEQSKTKGSGQRYAVDFSLALKDLSLRLDSDGLRRGTLNVSLIVYDRYGNIVSKEEHLAQLNIKPDAYAAFQQTGVPMHAEIEVPKSNYWLRTGVYDQGSRKVGTMEVALSSVVPLEVSTK